MIHYSTRALLCRRALERALVGGKGGQKVGQILRGGVLQLYVRPKGGENAFIRGIRNKNGTGNTECPSYQAEKVTPLYWDDVVGASDLVNDESEVLDENSMEIPLEHCKENGVNDIWICAEELKGTLQELGTRLNVDHLVADFVLDDNDKLWLSAVHDVIKFGRGRLSSSNQTEEKMAASAHQNALDYNHPDKVGFDRMLSVYDRTTERGRFGSQRHSKKVHSNVEKKECPQQLSHPSFEKEICAHQQQQQHYHHQLKESVTKKAGKATNQHGPPQKSGMSEGIQAVLGVPNGCGGGATTSLNKLCLKENGL